MASFEVNLRKIRFWLVDYSGFTAHASSRYTFPFIERRKVFQTLVIQVSFSVEVSLRKESSESLSSCRNHSNT